MRNKNIYLFEIIFLIFIILLKTVIINNFLDIYGAVIIIFLAISATVLYLKLGFRADNNICKTNTIQISIIALLLYILITYLSGLIFGFLKNSYSLEIISIIKNTYLFVIVIVLEETIRWMIANKCKKDIKPYYVITILFILLDIVMVYNSSVLLSNAKLFVFISNTCLSIIARNVISSYLCYKVSYLPGLIIRLFLTLYVYIVPIIPDLGDYINSVIGVLLPYLIYLSTSKLIQYAEHDRPSPIKKQMWYVNIPIIFLLVFVVILVSGVFRYQIMAIGSGSMEPIIYRGDAVVFEKVKDDLDIQEGQIIVFKKHGKYVTHRVVSIGKKNKEQYYRTKGDNNLNEDDFIVSNEDIVGIVKLKIKFIGYPTLWFQDLIS